MKSHTLQNVLTLEEVRARVMSDKYEKIEFVVHYFLLIINHLVFFFFEVKHINCQIYWFSKNLPSIFL